MFNAEKTLSNCYFFVLRFCLILFPLNNFFLHCLGNFYKRNVMHLMILIIDGALYSTPKSSVSFICFFLCLPSRFSLSLYLLSLISVL